MKLLPWVLAGVAVSPMAAQAFETRLNGFISVGAGMTLQDDQTYITDPVNFGSYDNELSIKPDTMVAIQSLSKVNDRLSATAQLVGFAGDDFDVKFEWAYVNYELLNDIDLKVGRIRMPVFNYSSSLDLGYSYAWVRPPVEVYNLFLTSLEGAAVDWNFSLGNWYGTASTYFGETDGVDPETGSYVEFESILGGSLLMENGSFALRGSHSIDDDVTVNRTVYSPEADLASGGTLNGDGVITVDLNLPMTFSSVSAIYDNGTVLLNSEYTLTRFTNDLNNNEVAWYATAGMRLGSFTPHVTYSSFAQQTNSTTTVYAYDGAGGFVSADVADYPQDISSLTYGLRWDFDIATAMKLEYTTRTDNTEEPAVFAGKWSPFGDAQAISVAVDVVF